MMKVVVDDKNNKLHFYKDEKHLSINSFEQELTFVKKLITEKEVDKLNVYLKERLQDCIDFELGYQKHFWDRFKEHNGNKD